VPVQHHPVRHGTGSEIAPDEPEHPSVRDPLRQLPHQHIVVDPVEKLLQVHIHHPAPARLDVSLRLTHCLMRTPPRPKTVAVFRETGIDHGLQDLQDGLLDEPVEYGRDAQLPHPTARLRNLAPLHHAWLVAIRKQLLPDPRPVVAKIGGKIIHRPAIHAGAPLIPLHPLERAQQIPSLDNALHQVRVVVS
jgi:hypothetical protein